jgi:hypothetical protein
VSVVWGVGFRVEGLGCGDWGVGCGVWGLECSVEGLGRMGAWGRSAGSLSARSLVQSWSEGRQVGSVIHFFLS